MCRPGRLLLVLGVTLAPLPARAQDAAQLRDRVARLTRAFMHAQTLRAQFDTAATRRTPVDTVRVGGLRLVVAKSMTPTVRAAADTAWGALARTFGRAAAELQRTPLVVQVQGQTEGLLPVLAPARQVFVPAGAGPDIIARGIVMQGAQSVSSQQDSALQHWMLGTLIPRLGGGNRFDLVFEELVTSSRTVVRQCYNGDLQACARAIALAPTPDPVRDWYDAGDRRQMVSEFNGWERSYAGGAYQRCAQGGSDSACIAALHAQPEWLTSTVMQPMSGGARVSAVDVAIDVGGPGAYDRLLTSAGRTMADRLAAAAGVSVDSVLALWRARILAARPESLALQPSAAWAAVLWTVLLGFMALRSSRWR